MSSPAFYLEAVRQAWERDLLAKRKPQAKDSEPWRPEQVWASRIRACSRAMALDMLHPEDDPFGTTAEQLERAEQGNEMESLVNARLHRMGRLSDPQFKPEGHQQRFEIRDREVVVGVGKIDGYLRFTDGAKIPYDVKWGRSYASCETLNDLEGGVWSRGAIDQMLAYCFGGNYPWGAFVIPRMTELPSLIPVELEPNLARVEASIQRMRLAVEARAGRAPLPPFIQDVQACMRCPHLGKSCDPPLDYGAGVRTLADESLIQLAQIREANALAARDHDRADKKLKEVFREFEGLTLLGPYEVSVEFGDYTRCDIPKDVRAQYEVKDPRGRMSMKIRRAATTAKEVA